MLYMAASVLPVFAMQEGGTGALSWDSAGFILCMVFAGLVFITFATWIAYLSNREHCVAPLFPARIVTHRVMLASILYVYIGTPTCFLLAGMVNHRLGHSQGFHVCRLCVLYGVG